MAKHKKTIPIICGFCKISCFTRKDAVKAGKGKFCSAKCSFEFIKAEANARVKPLGKIKVNKSTNNIKGYRILHFWVEKQLGKPRFCTGCKTTDEKVCYHWANISQEYRKDISDWRRLCAGCHKREKKVLV